jgi:hypothetical protein
MLRGASGVLRGDARRRLRVCWRLLGGAGAQRKRARSVVEQTSLERRRTSAELPARFLAKKRRHVRSPRWSLAPARRARHRMAHYNTRPPRIHVVGDCCSARAGESRTTRRARQVRNSRAPRRRRQPAAPHGASFSPLLHPPNTPTHTRHHGRPRCLAAHLQARARCVACASCALLRCCDALLTAASSASRRRRHWQDDVRQGEFRIHAALQQWRMEAALAGERRWAGAG